MFALSPPGETPFPVALRILSLLSVAVGYLAVVFAPGANASSLVFLAAFALSATCRYTNPYQMLWMGSHYTFCVVPTLFLPIAGLPPVFDIALVCSLYTVAFVAATDHLSGPWRDPAASASPIVFLSAITVLVAVVLVLRSITTFELMLVLPTVVFLYAIAIIRVGKVWSVMLFGVLVAALGLFALVAWSGFGRLIFAGAMALAFLLLSYRVRLSIGRTLFFVIMVVGSLLGTFLRFPSQTADSFLTSIPRDSTFSPIILGQRIVETAYGRPVDFGGIVDQFVLFVLAPFPRDLWPGKPLGFGFQYTVDNLGQQLIDAGHSIAATFAGEHVYYLGLAIFHLTLIAAVFLFWLLCRVASDRRLFHGSLAINALMYLPTFYWGGMQSFAARFLTGLPLMLVVQLIVFWPQVRNWIADRRMAVTRG